MTRFGFILHPVDPKRDVSRKFPLLGRLLTPRQINFLCAFFPPVRLSLATGIRSAATGAEIEGQFVACPYTPERMMQLPARTVYRKITHTARLAERLGAELIGLGAFTSVIGDAGMTIARRLHTPVTTGDSYTVAVAVEALLAAGARMGIDPSCASVAVVGATGAIGSAAAAMLAEQVECLLLVGRDGARLHELGRRLEGSRAKVMTTRDLDRLPQAELILAASSATRPLIHPRHLAPGAVVCDIARPHDVSPTVPLQRDDVIIIDGGMVAVPGRVDYGFDFGFPPGTTYACMAETMALALENRLECFTLGKELDVDRIREIDAIASRHGFRLAGMRSFDRPLTEADFERARQRASKARRVKRGVL